MARPLCLPQTHPGWQAPFVRAFGDGYESAYGLPAADFVRFVDGLNTSLVGSPPLQVLGAVGSVGASKRFSTLG